MEDIYELREQTEIDENTARQYFGENFIRTYEHIKNICIMKGCYLGLHGTFIDNCKSILKEGLIHESNSMRSTMASAKNYADLLNWRVQHIGGVVEGLVMITVPKECILKYHNKEQRGLWHGVIQNDEFENIIDDTKIQVDKYAIPREFILGYIDLKNKSIELNRYYDIKYDSDELFLDEGLTHSLIPEKKSKIITADEPEWGDDDLEI